MALAKQDEGTKKKTNTQTVTVGGRTVNVPATNTPTVSKPQNTATVGGRVINTPSVKPSTQRSAGKAPTINKTYTTADRKAVSASGKHQAISAPNPSNYTKQANDYLNQQSKPKNQPQEYEKLMSTPFGNPSKIEETRAEQQQIAQDFNQAQADKRAASVAKIQDSYNQGKLSEDTVNDINGRFGALIDENGNEADVIKYQNDVDLVNRTAEELQKKIDKLNNDYTNGKIDYDTYQVNYDAYRRQWEDNSAVAQRLGSYKALSGFDYYDWAKQTGKDVTDFESYVEHVDDTFAERLANEYVSSWADTLNILPETLSVLSEVMGLETENVDKFSGVMKETSAELRDYAFAGASPVSEWSLQCIGSLLPMINSMMVGSFLPVDSEAFTNVALGLQSGTETTRQRLAEGVDPGIAVMNGILHGIVTGLVEAKNMGEISDLVTGGGLKYMVSLGLNQVAGPKAIGQYMFSIAMNEGTEEVLETLIDWGVDKGQNLIVGAFNGDMVTPTELNPAEMANEFVMAAAGTVLLGAPSAVNIVVNSKQRYNAAMEARKHFESVLGSENAMPEEKELARKGIEVIDYSVRPFEENSTIANAVDLASDFVEPIASYDELMNNLANAIQPDVTQQLETARATLENAQNIKDSLQESLLERGVRMSANDFIDMTPEARNEYMSLATELNKANVGTIFGNMMSGQNGMTLSDGIAINTDQTRSIDIDALADLDRDSYRAAMKGEPNDIFKAAGANPSATAAAVHEVTHFAEQSGQWNKLRNLVEQAMGKERFELAKSRLEAIYKSRGVMDVNAEHEAVAFFIQKNLGNKAFIKELAKSDASLFTRLYRDVKAFFKGDARLKLENTLMKAIIDSKRIVDVSVKNGSVAPAMSIGSWEDTDADALAKAITDELNQDKTLGSEEVKIEDVKKWIDSVNSVASMVANDIDRLGYVSNSTYSAMKSNSDYKYTIDMSTLCKKRLLLQGTIDAVQRAMPNTALTSMDYIMIRNLMANKGLEVSCGFCYVESARRLLGKVAEEFIESKGYTDVTIADLITVDGVENLQKTSPDVYNEFVKYNNARGQQRAMLVQTRTEYKGEIRNLTEKAVADLIKSGGLRLQSYSDFETPHLIDMMQVVLDMASKGLTSQAYTKVPNFADAFGNTNIKINLSLVCKGLDENGELIFDDVEGMPHEDAFRLRDKYSKNVGTILVGKDDATILAAMADPRIDYIIPFHRSGWANDEFEALGITGYGDYTKQQHEKLITPVQYEIMQGPNKGQLSKPTRNPKGGDILPLSYWDYSVSGRDNAVKYLELCREQKRVPKFAQFLEHHTKEETNEKGEIEKEEWWELQRDGSTDGYWKTLIDFKMYDNDGVGSPQMRVVPIFDDAVNKRILDEYKGGHRNLRAAEDVVQEFLRTKAANTQYSLGAQRGIDNLRQWGVDNNDEASIKEAEDLEHRRELAREMRREIQADFNSIYKYISEEEWNRRVAEKRKEIEDDVNRDNQTQQWYENEVIEDLIMEKYGWRITDQGNEAMEFFTDDDFDKLKKIIETTEGRKTNFKKVIYFQNEKSFEDIFGKDSKLLKMYPNLKDIKFGVVNRASSTTGATLSEATKFVNGQWEYEPRVIYVNKLDQYGDPRPMEKFVTTIGHEVQHLIQDAEGFPKGGDANKMSFRKYYNLPGEVEARSEGKKAADPSKRLYKGDIIITSNGIPIDDDGNTIKGNGEIGELRNTGGEDSFDGNDNGGNQEPAEEVRQPNEGVPPQENEPGTSGGEDVAEPVEPEPLDVPDDKLNITSGNLNDLPNNKTARVLGEKPKGESLRDLLKQGGLQARRFLIDKYAAVDDLAKRYNNKKLTYLADRVMRTGAIASRAIYDGIVNKDGKVIGKSLMEIMGKISPQDKQLFGEYMYHWRNVDEMSMVKRFGKDYTDKPVFGNDVTADDSMDRIREIEKTHPEFKEVAEDMWELYRNLLGIRRDAGIISQKTYDKFIKERPHYVRIIRNVNGGTGGTALNPNDIKRFKGSTEDILPIEDATVAHIQSTYRVANNNELNSEILKTLGAVEESEIDDIESLVEDGYEPLTKGSKTLSAYRNGVKYSMDVSDELAKALTPTEKNVLMKIGDRTIAPISQFRKALITSINPIFTLFTNPAKDLQDVIRNSKYLKNYPRAFVKAVDEIIHGGELSKLYDNVGVRASNYMGQDIEKALRKINNGNIFAKAWNKARNLAENIEKAPRLAEFIASLEAGNSIDQAAYDAAEVTTNFKRGGTAVKTADKYGFTFLSASVAGFDKQIRNAKDDVEKIRKNGIKGMISVLAQLTLASGLPLRMLLDYLWRDDDDYENLSDYVKNNYYIVGKTNGRFIRIPKGRVAAFYQTVLDNIDKTVKKQVDVWDALLDDLVSFENNLAPNNFMDNNMFSPLVQAYRTPEGRTWYGEDLVPSRLQDVPDYEQYDEGTDSLSIAIGQLSKKVADALGNDKFQISPYKLNYILDQYTGFIGDVALPALSLETSTSVDGVLKGPATAILDKFTTDPILKNQNVTSFYSLKEEMDKKAKGSQATDEEKLVSKYLGTVSSAMGKLYGEKRKIQLDPNLSNKEKLQRVREIQTQINDLARNALGSYDQIDMVGKYASVGDVQYYQNEDGSWTKPTSNALEKLNNADLSMEDRNAYFQTYGEIDKIRADIRSNTPKGEQAEYRDATIEAINNSKLSAKGKNAMYDSYYSSKFSDYVNDMDLTDEQKYNIKVAKTLANSEKDANGKTIANSKAWATADAYKELGVLEDVLKYIKDNDIKPSDMGLSKTVYESLLSGSSSSSSRGKTSSKSSKKSSSSKVSGGSAGGITRAKGGGSTKRLSMAANPIRETKTTNSFVKAYADVLKRNSSKATSSGNGTVICPKCGNRVSSGLSRCPICGTSL